MSIPPSPTERIPNYPTDIYIIMTIEKINDYSTRCFIVYLQIAFYTFLKIETCNTMMSFLYIYIYIGKRLIDMFRYIISIKRFCNIETRVYA